MSIEESEKKFNERFARLKSALNVESDSELAGALGITQQSVFGAKKRNQIPVSWLEEAGQNGVSLNFIFFGELPVMRELVDYEPVDDEKAKDNDPDREIAERLVKIAIGETGFNPSHAGKLILERFVKRKVIGDLKSEIIEMLRDVMASERESEESSDAA